MASLFAATSALGPEDITEADLIHWCSGAGTTIANNTVRQRISEARSFLAWCTREGHIAHDPALDLLAPHSPLKAYSKVYGKQQGKHPGRWLSRAEAQHMFDTARDGTDAGLRDELVIRLGILGLRQVEIARLTWSNLDRLPTITWIGKRYKPRTAKAGPALLAVLDEYRSAYERATGRTVHPDWPVICKAVSLGGRKHKSAERPVEWCQPMGLSSGIYSIVNGVGHRAGLGHIAPHDLRRSAAGILHNHTTADGAHHFDLLDIQKVLGHADPATTMRSYLDPLDTAVIDRAAQVLD